MKYIVFILMVMVGILFSGCAVKGDYDRTYISDEINPYLVKTEVKSVCIQQEDTVLRRVPGKNQNLPIQALDIYTGQITTEIAKEYFSQYFKKVTLENCKGNTDYILYINVKDFFYRHYNIVSATSIEYELNINLYDKNKNIIFEKKYFREDNNKLLFLFFKHPKHGTVELFHRNLLDLYETELKKDLLKVL